MNDRRFIILKRTPDGDLALFGHELEPVSEREARIMVTRYIANTVEADGEPEQLHVWEVTGGPVSVPPGNLDDLSSQ